MPIDYEMAQSIGTSCPKFMGNALLLVQLVNIS